MPNATATPGRQLRRARCGIDRSGRSLIRVHLARRRGIGVHVDAQVVARVGLALGNRELSRAALIRIVHIPDHREGQAGGAVGGVGCVEGLSRIGSAGGGGAVGGDGLSGVRASMRSARSKTGTRLRTS